MKRLKVGFLALSLSLGGFIVSSLSSCSNENNETTKEFSVKLEYDASLGEVSVDKTSGHVGEKVFLTIKPNSGVKVGSVKINGDASNNDLNQSFMAVEGENVVRVDFTKNPAEDNYFTINLTINNPEGGSVTLDKNSGKAGEKVKLTFSTYSGYTLSSITFNGDFLSIETNEIYLTPHIGENDLIVTFALENDALIDALFKGETYTLDFPDKSEQSDLEITEIYDIYEKYFSNEANSTLKMDEGYPGGKNRYYIVYEYFKKHGFTKADLEKFDQVYGSSNFSSLMLNYLNGYYNDFNNPEKLDQNELLVSLYEVGIDLFDNFEKDKLIALIAFVLNESYSTYLNSMDSYKNIGPSGFRNKKEALNAREYFVKKNNTEAVNRIDEILNTTMAWPEDYANFTISNNTVLTSKILYSMLEHSLEMEKDPMLAGSYFADAFLLTNGAYDINETIDYAKKADSIRFFANIFYSSFPSYDNFVTLLPSLENLNISDSLILLKILNSSFLAYGENSESLLSLIKENSKAFYYSFKFLLKSLSEGTDQDIQSFIEYLNLSKSDSSNDLEKAKLLSNISKFIFNKINSSGENAETLLTYLEDFVKQFMCMYLVSKSQYQYKNDLSSGNLVSSSATIYVTFRKYNDSKAHEFYETFKSLSHYDSKNLSNAESEEIIDLYSKLKDSLNSYETSTENQYTINYDENSSENYGITLTSNNEEIEFEVSSFKEYENIFELKTEDGALIYFNKGEISIYSGSYLGVSYGFILVDEDGSIVHSSYQNYKNGIFYLEKDKKYNAIESTLRRPTITDIDTSTVGAHYLYTRYEERNLDYFLTYFVYEKEVDYYSFESLDVANLRTQFTIHYEDYTYNQSYVYGYQELVGYDGIKVTLKHDRVNIKPLDYFVDVSQGAGKKYFDVISEDGQTLKVVYYVGENINIQQKIDFMNSFDYFYFEDAPCNENNISLDIVNTITYEFNNIKYFETESESFEVSKDNFKNGLDNSTYGWKKDVYLHENGQEFEVEYYVNEKIEYYSDVYYFDFNVVFMDYDLNSDQVEFNSLVFGDLGIYKDENDSLIANFFRKDNSYGEASALVPTSDLDLSSSGFKTIETTLNFPYSSSEYTPSQGTIVYYVAEINSISRESHLEIDLNALPSDDEIISLNCSDFVEYYFIDNSLRSEYLGDSILQIKFSEIKDQIELVSGHSGVIEIPLTDKITLVLRYYCY